MLGVRLGRGEDDGVPVGAGNGIPVGTGVAEGNFQNKEQDR
jgi:hypothetical protein